MNGSGEIPSSGAGIPSGKTANFSYFCSSADNLPPANACRTGRPARYGGSRVGYGVRGACCGDIFLTYGVHPARLMGNPARHGESPPLILGKSHGLLRRSRSFEMCLFAAWGHSHVVRDFPHVAKIHSPCATGSTPCDGKNAPQQPNFSPCRAEMPFRPAFYSLFDSPLILKNIEIKQPKRTTT